jgi:ABC-type phosphate transport system substrate-binding protein
MRFLLFNLALLWLGLALPVQAEERIAVIVARHATQRTLSAAQLARIYLRKSRFWDDGTMAIPVNLPATHPLRLLFSRSVLGELPEDQEAYWNEQYFHGIAPPFVLDSEEAVLQFVLSTPGAVGYVSEAAVTNTVHVLLHIPRSASPGEKKSVP